MALDTNIVDTHNIIRNNFFLKIATAGDPKNDNYHPDDGDTEIGWI